MNLIDIKEKYIEANSRKKFLENHILELSSNLEDYKEHRDDLIKARYLINDVTEATQNLFKDRVEKLTTLAIRSVFDRPYNFKLLFEKKRNKVECKLVIEENGEEFIPKDEKGGGILPIIGFALRVVMWSLENPKSRPFMLLDEPVKGAIGHKGDLLNKTAMMMKEISQIKSKEIPDGIQIVLITHEPAFLEVADRAYEISHDGKESTVKLIKEEDFDDVELLKELKPKLKKIKRRKR